MNKALVAVALAAAALGHGSASASLVSCTVLSGTVLTSTGGGLAFSIANGIGTSSGGATGIISCPAIVVGSPGLFINSYQVLATAAYTDGPFGTTSGTTVSELFSLVGGPLSGASFLEQVSGGSSGASASPFQIGSTLGGATSYSGFSVNVASAVVAGGPVGTSRGQVFISFEVGPAAATVPEPGSLAVVLAGLTALGFTSRRSRAA